MVTEHKGVLRARITILDGDRIQVEWVGPDGVAVWTETCAPREGCAFVSQVECSGEFRTLPGYFVDGEGKRHFVMKAEPGRFGAKMGKAGAADPLAGFEVGVHRGKAYVVKQDDGATKS